MSVLASVSSFIYYSHDGHRLDFFLVQKLKTLQVFRLLLRTFYLHLTLQMWAFSLNTHVFTIGQQLG